MKMKDKVDTLIVVSNDQLLQIVPENTPLTDAFLVADDILRQGVVGISEIIIKPGLVNVDFADVRTIMGNAGINVFCMYFVCIDFSIFFVRIIRICDLCTLSLTAQFAMNECNKSLNYTVTGAILSARPRGE